MQISDIPTILFGYKYKSLGYGSDIFYFILILNGFSKSKSSLILATSYLNPGFSFKFTIFILYISDQKSCPIFIILLQSIQMNHLNDKPFRHRFTYLHLILINILHFQTNFKLFTYQKNS